MQKPSSGRGAKPVFLLLAAAVAGGCSSSSSQSNPQGTGGTGATTGGAGGSSGTGGGGSLSCEKVIVEDLEIPIGFGPWALTAVDGKVYALIDDFGARTVRVAQSGKLVELARTPREEDLDINHSILLVDANGYFFDVYQGGKKWLVGAPVAGGAAVPIAPFTDSKELVDPPLIGDATSLFFVGTASGDRAILRVPRMVAAAASPLVVTDYTVFYNGLTAIAAGESSLYAVSGNGSDYTAREFPKDPDMRPGPSRAANFVQSICGTFAVPPHLVVASDALYLGCLQPGGAQEAIYRLPPSAQWPTDSSDVMLDPPLALGKIASDNFIVVGTNVYFANYDQDTVFKVPTTGGTPTRVLSAYNVEHIASDGTTLFVRSGCGIQSTPL